MTPARSSGRRPHRIGVMAMLGVRMMLHDRAKLVGTVLGVVFAVVLMNQQIGILFALLDKNTMLVDHSGADIWILPRTTKTLEGGTRISIYWLNRARGHREVDWAEPLLYGTATVVSAEGTSEAVTLIGTRSPRFAGGPWNLVAGSVGSLDEPDTMIFEDSKRTEFGAMNLGSVRELAGHRVVAGGFTWGLLPFGPPYAFAEYDTAREILAVDPDETSFVLVGVRDHADPAVVRDELARLLPSARVILSEDFSRSIVTELLAEQLGVSFGTSTAFALVVGFVVVALAMFSAVVDNIREFGTLKAMGARTFDLAKLLFTQAVLYAIAGTTVGLFLITRIAEGMRGPAISLVLPWWMYVGSFVAMITLCLAASSLALFRVRSVEPAMVFR
jgi:putative ABC transport system permease protein